MRAGKFLYIVMSAMFFLAGTNVSAQCAMCRAALETNEQGIQPEAVNDGIVYLMVFPYLLVGLVGYVIYRMRQKANLSREAQ